MKQLPEVFTACLLSLVLAGCDNTAADQRAAKEQELQRREAELNRKEQALKQRPTPPEASPKAAGPTTALAALLQGTTDQPVPISRLTAALGEPTQFERADFEKQPSGPGNRYHWTLPTGLHVTAYSGGEGSQPDPNDAILFLSLTPADGQAVEQLPYGLVLNKTTEADCRQLFGAELQSDAYEAGTKGKIHRDGVYTFLYFDKAGKLVEIQYAVTDLDTVG